MTATEELLKSRGVRPSYQRVRILDYLAGTKEHPSVDAIYGALSPELPTLSRTTVYNTLSLFVAEGLVQPILIDGEELRYDADTRPHGHFRCRACGRVFDFALPSGGLSPELPPGFKPELVQLYCLGLCPACSEAWSSAGAAGSGG